MADVLAGSHRGIANVDLELSRRDLSRLLARPTISMRDAVRAAASSGGEV